MGDSEIADQGRKTEQSHWDAAHDSPVRLRLPIRLNPFVLNITRLLKRRVKPGDRYIEIGCAPGKLLAWVSSVLKADAAGLDYSEAGILQCRTLFKALKLDIDLYHEDFFDHQLPLESFDVVSSFGVIEHFDDAAPIVKRHIDLVKAGGVAIMMVPNYGGIYGRIQSWCDPPNLAIHNLNIMNVEALRALVSTSPEIESVRAYPFGTVDPAIVSFEKKLPRFLVMALNLSLVAIGILQPVAIDALAPMLILEVRKTMQQEKIASPKDLT